MLRNHTIEEEDEDCQDHLAFWPIGQWLLAKLARSILDSAHSSTGYSSVQNMTVSLKPLALVPWDLHRAPWRHLLLVPKSQGDQKNWKMRSEDRKMALDVALRLLRWIVGLDPLDDEEIGELRSAWWDILYFEPSQSEIQKMWDEVLNIRASIVQGS